MADQKMESQEFHQWELQLARIHIYKNLNIYSIFIICLALLFHLFSQKPYEVGTTISIL